MSFFQVLQSALRKNEKKLRQKKNKIQKSKRKTLIKRERKTKNEKKSNSNNKYFFTVTFFKWENLYCVEKHIWKKLVYIVQKQPSRGVLRKKCSENMQQIFKRTPMP